MQRLPTAAALAILLVTASIAGVVSADQNGTAIRTNATDENATATVDDPPASVDTRPTAGTFEAGLAHRLAQFDLTDGQIRVIVNEASRLHEDGASRLVVRSSIVLHLYEYGVDEPFLHADGTEDRRHGAHDRLHRFIRSLDVTPEQARELHAMVHRLHESGATREEIRRAIHRQLAGWDVDPPTERPDGVDRFVDRVATRHDLSDAQAGEVERLVRGMLGDGAYRGEIKAAVARLVRSWVDRPRVPDRPTATSRGSR